MDQFLTELWHLLDVSTVSGHGAALAALLLTITIKVYLLLFRPVEVAYG